MSGARGERAELGLEADQAARRNHVVEPHAALAVGIHAGELAAALAERLHDRALRALVQVDRERLVRLARLAFDFLDDHARPRDRELVAFAPHVLEQHAEVQLAAAVDAELVRDRRSPRRAARRCVSASRSSRSRIWRLVTYLPSRPQNGELFTSNVMLIVGSSTTSGGSASGVVGSQIVSEISGYSMPANATMSPALASSDLDAMQAEKAHHLHDALVAHLAFAIHDDDRAVAPDLAALDAADADRADVARIVEQADLQLQRAVLVDVRRRAVLHDGFEQRRHVGGRLARLIAGEAAQRRGVDDREVELRFARAELVEQIERLVEHPVRARLVAVDLVDDHDRPQAVLERLLRHEARLRHRAVDGVDQQQHRVDHRQHALDLAAEVGVARACRRC